MHSPIIEDLKAFRSQTHDVTEQTSVLVSRAIVEIASLRFSKARLAEQLADLKAERANEQKVAKRRYSGNMRKGSQCSRILAFLLLGNTLTPIKARALFRAERLAARITELKQAGHKITSTIKRDLNGKTYAEYSMRSVDTFGRKKK